MEAITTRKSSPIHRKSFNPVSHHLPTFAYLKRNRLIGKLGEQLMACKFIRHGHKILETNYNIPNADEIDIISQQDGILVFTQVQTQTKRQRWEDSRSRMINNKGDRIMHTVQHYMETNNLDCDFRFDVAEVLLGKGAPEIRILEEALSEN